MTTAKALSILQQKEDEKPRKDVIKEARRQNKISKTTSKLLKSWQKQQKRVLYHQIFHKENPVSHARNQELY